MRHVERGILSYVGSAVLTSLSAAFYVVAGARRLSGLREDSSALGALGDILLIGGTSLACLSLALLTVAFLGLRRENSTGLRLDQGVSLATSSFFWALALPGVAVPLLAVGFVYGRSTPAFAVGGVLAGLAGLLFVLATSLLGMAFVEVHGRTTLWIGAFGGMIGVAGETALMLGVGGGGSPDWITFGGIPLLNENVPFGVLVGASALMIWASYRRIRTDRRAWQRGRGLKSPD
jgi:hypothetical protein